LGTFEQGEYSLAEQYADYVRSVLLSPVAVSSDEELRAAKKRIIEQEDMLATELRELTRFKRKIFDLTF
jgi:hypothetical protein